MSNVIVLYEGYSYIQNEYQSVANCSCTLVKSENVNIIIDTMTPWDSHKILNAYLACHMLSFRPLTQRKQVAGEPAQIMLVKIASHAHYSTILFKSDMADFSDMVCSGSPEVPSVYVFMILDHTDQFFKVCVIKKNPGLQEHGLTPQDIKYVVSSHGHSDHIGNNNLFLEARHIVGFNISFKDTYYFHPFDKGIGYKIGDDVEVIPTPGHTFSDVTVIVKEPNEVIAITGDLFERFEDIADPTIWKNAGSEDELQQKHNRLKVAKMADWIIPGHGPKFRVTNSIIEILQKQVDNF